MIFKKEFEFKFDYEDFNKWRISNDYNDNYSCKEEMDEILKYYFEEICTETEYYIAMDYIIEIADYVWKEYNKKEKKEIPIEKEIQNEIENNYNFEDLIRTIMDTYYSQGYQIEKIENQIASACIAKINQISWQKAINALKN